MCYLWALVCLMWGIQFVLCAVVSLCHVQFAVTNLIASLRACLASLGEQGPKGRAQGKGPTMVQGQKLRPGALPHRQQTRSSHIYTCIYVYIYIYTPVMYIISTYIHDVYTCVYMHMTVEYLSSIVSMDTISADQKLVTRRCVVAC